VPVDFNSLRTFLGIIEKTGYELEFFFLAILKNHDDPVYFHLNDSLS